MTMTRTPLTQAAATLKARFREIGYTTSGINNVLGPDFVAAMHAGQPAAVRFHLDSLPESDLNLALRASC